MTDSKDIVVTQRDRARAVLLHKTITPEMPRRSLTRLLEGQCDGDRILQQLARHRITSTEAERARADKAEALLREAVGILRCLHEATDPHIVHNVGVGELRDEVEDFLANIGDQHD